MIKTIKICACKEKTKCLKQYIFRIFEEEEEEDRCLFKPFDS